jgi:hypothetical protein
MVKKNSNRITNANNDNIIEQQQQFIPNQDDVNEVNFPLKRRSREKEARREPQYALGDRVMVEFSINDSKYEYALILER